MPTYGWVREDGLEAFYEGTERFRDPGPPSAPAFRCPFCSNSYETKHDLQNHVSAEHKVERPILMIRGKEPPHRTTVRMRLTQPDIYVENATRISLVLNGALQECFAPEHLSSHLASYANCEVRICLTNDTEKNTTPVVSEYELSIRAATVEQLRDVERAFHEIIMKGEMSRASIGLFLDDQRTKGVAAEYATALAEYSLGVLLKERPDTEPLTTPFARYREAYGSSLQKLADFDRPMAYLISNLIRFAMNDFSAWNVRTGYWELDLANSVLHDPEMEDIDGLGDIPEARTPICPVDHGIGQILALTERMTRQDRWSPILDEECRSATSTDVLDATDRQKALAIWAASAWRLEAKESAIEPLRQIAATYPFSNWAEPFLESVNK